MLLLLYSGIQLKHSMKKAYSDTPTSFESAYNGVGVSQ
jgi:hypothetical protein